MTTKELVDSIPKGLTLVEKAACVRKALKTQLGYGPKQVSCRVCTKTEQACIILGINDPQVDIDRLFEEFVFPFRQKVSRLRVSGI